MKRSIFFIVSMITFVMLLATGCDKSSIVKDNNPPLMIKSL